MTGDGAKQIADIDVALREWRQGDATLDAGLIYVHLADKRLPLTDVARDSLADASEENVFEVVSTVRGLVVVTQTCDIVKPCASSEFVDVSPLVQIPSEELLYQIQKGRRVRYAYVAGVSGHGFAADLERTMTVEKSVVAGWTRIPGCVTDAERVAFAEALARKRSRFAFPNEFNAGLVKFRDRLKSKREANSAEGRLIDALAEVRAEARPSWDAAAIEIFFWFLLTRNQTVGFDESRKIAEKWIGLMALPSPFILADSPFALVEREDMTVRDYLASHRLDYDDLSL